LVKAGAGMPAERAVKTSFIVLEFILSESGGLMVNTA
jgi:hypothetical protein